VRILKTKYNTRDQAKGLLLNTDCPKCLSHSAWLSREGPDILLKCLCGFLKVVETTLGSMKVEHSDTGSEVRLPRPKTHLHRTLMCLSILDLPSSAEVTERLQDLGVNRDVSDVSSYLTILKTKGLVETVVVRRGMTGGSTWRLTNRSIELIGF